MYEDQQNKLGEADQLYKMTQHSPSLAALVFYAGHRQLCQARLTHSLVSLWIY